MKKKIFLLSKDALSIENLPLYGNGYWKTPNLDEICSKGTVFMNHYTAATSTSMAFSSMLTGKYPYEFENRKKYVHVPPNEHRSIFDELQAEGYDCHILWSEDYMTGAWPYVRCFGDEEKTKIHIVDMRFQAGIHRKKDCNITRSEEQVKQACNNIFKTLESIEDKEKQFIWLHLPHVIKGRISYGDDIDVFDYILGYVREKYGDDNIYITSDHGHMNLHKNIMAYGFHVYELTCRVPLITPRINNIKKVNFLTSNVDLKDIILNNNITKREYIYVDSQYYAQPDRKLAVITERFKYIFNKREKTEELYDLKWDPNERFNLLEIERYDNDKNILRRVIELYFYPYRKDAMNELQYLRGKKDDIWKIGTVYEEFNAKIRATYRCAKAKLIAKLQSIN